MAYQICCGMQGTAPFIGFIGGIDLDINTGPRGSLDELVHQRGTVHALPHRHNAGQRANFVGLQTTEKVHRRMSRGHLGNFGDGFLGIVLANRLTPQTVCNLHCLCAKTLRDGTHDHWPTRGTLVEQRAKLRQPLRDRWFVQRDVATSKSRGCRDHRRPLLANRRSPAGENCPCRFRGEHHHELRCHRHECRFDQPLNPSVRSPTQ